jgi:hypothetical protein
MTFNVINLTSLTFNVLRLNVFDVLIAISDDEYCLERDVAWRSIFQPNICVQTLSS